MRHVVTKISISIGALADGCHIDGQTDITPSRMNFVVVADGQ